MFSTGVGAAYSSPQDIPLQGYIHCKINILHIVTITLSQGWADLGHCGRLQDQLDLWRTRAEANVNSSSVLPPHPLSHFVHFMGLFTKLSFRL